MINPEMIARSFAPQRRGNAIAPPSLEFDQVSDGRAMAGLIRFRNRDSSFLVNERRG
jgi:hypothetical protein